MVLTPTVVEKQPKVVALFTTAASPITLAIEALGVASITVRRLMRQSGCSPTEIDTERRRCDRLVERLRRGGEVREHERRFIAGALAIMSVLHLTADHRAGGRGKAMADAYERAAEELAALWNPPRTEAPAPGPRPTSPRLAPPRFVVGQRVVENAISPIEAVRILGTRFGFDVPLPRSERAGSGGASLSAAPTAPPDWPDPQPLGTALTPVAPFDPTLMPGSLQPWLADVAHRLQAPPDFAGVAAIVALASVIGRAVGIRPRQHDDWTIVPNLWGAAVGESGIAKSPSMKSGLQFLDRLAAEAFEEHEQAMQAAASGEAVKEAELKRLKSELQQSVNGKARKPKRGGHLRVVEDDEEPDCFEPPRKPEEIAAELQEVMKKDPTPQLRRYMVNDATVEKLGELLNQNLRGLLLFRDELPGFLRKMEANGHEGDRAFFLECWTGNGLPFIYDRIARGTIRIEAPTVSLLGGIQPGPLLSYLRSTWKDGAGEDGFIQRFQLLVWPDTPRSCQFVDQWPNTEAKNRVFQIFRRAAEPGLAVAVGAFSDPDDEERIPFLRFDRDAQPVVNDWMHEVQKRTRAADEHPAMQAHLAKYPSLMPSLALIFHIVAVLDGAPQNGAVALEHAQLAIRWTEYLETHARRLYAAATARNSLAGEFLAEKIKSGKIAAVFTARDIYSKGWAGLTDRDDVQRAIDELGEADWIRPAVGTRTTGRGGRPTVRYEINPKARGGGA